MASEEKKNQLNIEIDEKMADGTYANLGSNAQKGLLEVDLDIKQGIITSLIGPSGCGKSTLLRVASGLEENASGTCEVDRESIGYVFQGIGLFPHLNISDNIGIVPRLLGWEAHRIARRVDELLELVRLDPTEHASRMPAELSGGQQQRVGFARALAEAKARD